jgi:hypothetical protein
MEKLIHESLPSLAKDLEFRVEKISPLDHYYTDGSACGSFLKLVLERKGSTVSIYFFPSGIYWSSASLSQEEESVLEGWLAVVKSRKIERSG